MKTTPTTTQDPIELERTNKWQRLQEKRKQSIADHCLSHTQTSLDELLEPVERKDFDILDLTVVDEAHKLVYCYVPRVSTMKADVWTWIF